MRFTKKPVTIEAFRMGIDPRPDWFTEAVTRNDVITYSLDGEGGGPFEFNRTYCEIHTLEGVHRGDYGDYIIRGVKGELYPCKPDIFAMTYEPAGESSPKAGDVEAVNWERAYKDEYKLRRELGDKLDEARAEIRRLRSVSGKEGDPSAALREAAPLRRHGKDCWVHRRDGSGCTCGFIAQFKVER